MLSFQRNRINNKGELCCYNQSNKGWSLITYSQFLLGIVFEYDIPFAPVLSLSVCAHCQYSMS